MRRFSVTGVISFALPAFVVTALSGASQTPLAAYHDLSVMARWPLGKMQVRGAMGQSGSFALVELPAGGRTTAHHHTQEQIVLGVRGSMDVSLGGASHVHRISTDGPPRLVSAAPEDCVVGRPHGCARPIGRTRRR
jgi:hypothetical protein